MSDQQWHPKQLQLQEQGPPQASLREQLLQLLTEAGTPNQTARNGPQDVVCGGQLSRISPKLEVDSVAVQLPLSAEGAAALKARCSLAPFGRGEQTLTDTAVRHTWQVEPDRLAIGNPRWEEEVVALAVLQTKAALGVHPDTDVAAHLYKLLLYEPGSHFKAHRDTEKEEGMFATMAISLPSEYQGGELMLSHAGNTTTLDLAPKNARASCYWAFYTDCEHQVLPVHSGHRLALVYNLCWSGQGPRPPAIAAGLVARAAELAAGWDVLTDIFAPHKLCYMLEHRYSEAALREQGLAAMKGADRGRAQVLVDAAQAGAPLDVHVALVTQRAVDDCSDDDGPQERGPPGLGAFQASKWAALAGPAPAFSVLDLDAKADTMQGAQYWHDQRVPDRNTWQDSGNEGALRVRWYYRAALVVWPHSKRLANFCDAQPDRVISLLQAALAGPAATEPQAQQRQQQQQSTPEQTAGETGASELDSEWEEEMRRYRESPLSKVDDADLAYQAPPPEASPAELAVAAADHLELRCNSFCGGSYTRAAVLLKAACQLGDAALAHRLVRLVRGVSHLGDPGLPDALVQACNTFGWEGVGQEVVKLSRWLGSRMKRDDTWSSGEALQMGLRLILFSTSAAGQAMGPAAKQAVDSMALGIAQSVCAALSNHEGEAMQTNERNFWAKQAASACCILALVRSAGAALAVQRIIRCMRARTAAFRAETSLSIAGLEVVDQLSPQQLAAASSAPLLWLLSAALTGVAGLVGPKPVEPADWAMPDVTVQCDLQIPCADCQAMQAFLLDPEATELTLSAHPTEHPHVNQFWRSKARGAWQGTQQLAPGLLGVVSWHHAGNPSLPSVPELTLRKNHSAYDAAVHVHERRLGRMRRLLEHFTQALLLLLPGAVAAGGSAAPGRRQAV